MCMYLAQVLGGVDFLFLRVFDGFVFSEAVIDTSILRVWCCLFNWLYIVSGRVGIRDVDENAAPPPPTHPPRPLQLRPTPSFFHLLPRLVRQMRSATAQSFVVD